MVSELAAAKGFTVEQLERFGVRQGSRGVEIPYFDAQGAEWPRTRIRTAIAARDGSEWSRGDAPLVPYGLQRPVAWEKRYVFIVEGETDCWALWTAGKPALGIPGASNAKCLNLEHVDGAAAIYVVREPGEAGKRFPHKVADRLYSHGYAGQIFAIELGEAKDPHELWRRDAAHFEDNVRPALVTRELLPRPEKSAPPLGVTSLASLLKNPDRKPVEWVVDGLLGRGRQLMIAAKPKVGKSVLARNLALSVLRGAPFLDRDTKRGTVLWARFEEPYEEFLTDLEAMGFGDVAEGFFTNEDMPSPAERVRWLISLAQKMRPDLIVVDTFGKLLGVEDIDKYGKVLSAVAPLRQLSLEYGIAQLWIHHAKKGLSADGDAVLGSSALFGECDSLMILSSSEKGVRTIRTEQRYGTAFEATALAMDPSTKTITLAADRLVARRLEIEGAIIELLSRSPALSRPEILDQLDFRSADVIAAVGAMEDRGLLSKGGTGVKGDPFTYSVLIRNAAARSGTYVRFGSDSDSDQHSEPVSELDSISRSDSRSQEILVPGMAAIRSTTAAAAASAAATTTSSNGLPTTRDESVVLDNDTGSDSRLLVPSPNTSNRQSTDVRRLSVVVPNANGGAA